MKTRIEQFWFKYSQLQYAVRNNDADAIATLDRELEPALMDIYGEAVTNPVDARSQFQFFIDLIRVEAEDPASVMRNSKFLQSLISRYFSEATPEQAHLSFLARARDLADEGLLNEVILDCLPDRIAVITPDYRYAYVNATNATYLDQRPIDMIGRHIVEFIGLRRFEQRVQANLDRCFAGEMVDYSFAKQVEGRTVVVRCRMKPCFSATGRMIGAIVIIQYQADRRRSIAA
ncbi:PAS domain-containing protein [Ensifer soli]|uniref:PAS domain-containing protein n=1 Tax=Ciceribacter sp. sgz301302 TaxID=3342379 RepID=UPI0035BAB300